MLMVCEYLMYKTASVRKGGGMESQFVFQKLELSFVLPSQTPVGFWVTMQNTVTTILQQEDTFKETSTSLIASVVKCELKSERCTQDFLFFSFLTQQKADISQVFTTRTGYRKKAVGNLFHCLRTPQPVIKRRKDGKMKGHCSRRRE